jgi:hypothetical protein
MATKSKMARASLGVTLTIMALVGMAHPGTGRADEICHFQPDTQSWTKLEVGGNAAAAHLANHDDASPGGTTSVTGTILDSSCQPAVCPCWTVETLRDAREAAIARGDTEGECGIVNEVIAEISFFSSSQPVPMQTLHLATTNGCHVPVADPCCAVFDDDSGTFPVGLEIHIEGPTFNACRQQIVQACTP